MYSTTEELGLSYQPGSMKYGLSNLDAFTTEISNLMKQNSRIGFIIKINGIYYSKGILGKAPKWDSKLTFNKTFRDRSQKVLNDVINSLNEKGVDLKKIDIGLGELNNINENRSEGVREMIIVN